MRFKILTLAAAFFLIQNCGGQSGRKTGDQVTLVTSFYPVYVMTVNVSRDVPGVRVMNLTRPYTGCLHDYQLTPADLKKMDNADVLVINGAGMESFLDKVVRQRAGLKIIESGAGIGRIRDATGEENPHLWVSLSNAVLQVRNIAQGLAAADPSRADAYGRNARKYTARLETLRRQMHKELDGLPVRDIVTFHEAFPYFAREFGLNTIAVVEREPGSEPGARELKNTIDLVRAHPGAVIFAEPQYPRKTADAIARETGAKVFILDPAVTGPLDPDAYIRIMERNLEVLKEALGGR